MAAEQVSSPRMVDLLLECVGEVFDDRVREESFTHLSKLPFELLPWLPTVRKRQSKQFAGADIFHLRETERAQRVLDGLPLRIENGGLELDDDGSFHASGIISGAGSPFIMSAGRVLMPKA